MGIYFGGDRDDVNNYSSTDWSTVKKLGEIKKLQKGVPIPREFDADYYIENRNKHSKTSPDYWEWSKLCAYSQAVYAFYRQVAVKFYSQYPLENEQDLLEFLDLKLKPQPLDPLAENLKQTETALCLQFSKQKTNRTLKAKFKKNATLRHLRKHAATAWAMYYALKQNLHIDDAIRFKQSFQNSNLEQDVDVLKAFRGCKVMQFYTGKLLSKNFLLKTLGLNWDIYEDEDGLQIYNQLVQQAGGFSTNDYSQILASISNKVNALKENKQFFHIISIYEYFNYINHMLNEILRLANHYYNGNEKFGIFYNDDGVDLFEQAANLGKHLTKILANEQDPLIARDIKRLNIMINQVLTYATKAYQHSNSL